LLRLDSGLGTAEVFLGGVLGWVVGVLGDGPLLTLGKTQFLQGLVGEAGVVFVHFDGRRELSVGARLKGDLRLFRHLS